MNVSVTSTVVPHRIVNDQKSDYTNQESADPSPRLTKWNAV